MAKEVLDEREFELINIIGAEMEANQRRLSHLMDLSLGMTNMLIRRLIAKGFIRIEQLNKRKMQYILTPKGFAEKMRKSVNYTLKTINSIGMIRNRLREVLFALYEGGARNFYIIGKHDLSMLVEMVTRDIDWADCAFVRIDEIPRVKVDGVLLICNEYIDEEKLITYDYVDLIGELAKSPQETPAFNRGLLFEKDAEASFERTQETEPLGKGW